ncbi:MAG: hypothetical protein Q8R53_02910 [Nanoarchaeota archaeon]|nr:hypothetical protein [Nanoarchaeota archaeon]
MTTTPNDTTETLGRKAAETALQIPIMMMSPEEAEERLAQINQEIQSCLSNIDRHLVTVDARLARLAELERGNAPASLSAETLYTDGSLMSSQEVEAFLADIESRFARLAELEARVAHAAPESRAQNDAGSEKDALDMNKQASSFFDDQLERALIVEHPLKKCKSVSHYRKRTVFPAAAGFVLGSLFGHFAFSHDESEELSYEAARAHIHSAASLGESRALRQRIEQETSHFDALQAERENSYSHYATITMATPEEALAQYNAFLESVGGELIVSISQYRAFAEAAGEPVTEAGICRAALGELYRAMAFRETDALNEQQFADAISFRCTDVDVESDHYRFVSYNGRAPQTGEDR